MDTINETLIRYYSNYDENGRLEQKSGQVEFLTSMRYIEQYLKPGDKVIDIGAGTGRYSRALADLGYHVNAVELVDSNIDIFKANLDPRHNITITQGNALDLSAFANNTFDISLLFGPMYHLYTKEDKIQALSEALRVTKNNGLLFVAYCISDGSIIQSGFLRKIFSINEYIKQGKIDPETYDTFSLPEDLFELVRKEDIDNLMSEFKAERLHYISTDLFTRYISDAVNAMDEDEYAQYLQYHYAVCERPDMVGITHHSLDIVRKTSK